MPEHARCPSRATPVVHAGPGLEVAEIFRRYLAPFKDKHALGPVEDRIARNVMDCRTAVLGGHLDVCTSCGFQRPAYNSCRNRHCPKCQALRGARWVEQRLDRILPVHYFHVVFTLPGDLRELARRNRALVFDLLLKSAAAALLTLGRDPKWFGASAQLGVTTVLHTWARDLHFHPHAHCIVTGGGLAPDGKTWVAAPPEFLLPVHVLGAPLPRVIVEACAVPRTWTRSRKSSADALQSSPFTTASGSMRLPTGSMLEPAVPMLLTTVGVPDPEPGPVTVVPALMTRVPFAANATDVVGTVAGVVRTMVVDVAVSADCRTLTS